MSKQIIIGIPGPWQTQSDIVTAIAKHSGGFLFAGRVLMELATKQGFGVEIQAHDPNMRDAFVVAGGGRISDEDLAAIARHHHTLYALSSDASIEHARQMMRVGIALLNAGGIAVKVESSGLAHSAARWRELATSENLFDLYVAFVTLTGDSDCFYSCGMHNFGLPDATVPRDLDPQIAVQVLNVFNSYLLAESPAFADGNTFSTDTDSPRFVLHKSACHNYEPDDPFHNPYGMWNLKRVQ